VTYWKTSLAKGRICSFFIILFTILTVSYSFGGEEIITKIEIEGNRRIESDAISSVIRSRTGDYLSPELVSKDIKNIFKMGYFSNVKADYSTGELGPVIKFIVEERPFIASVRFEGAVEVEEKALQDAVTVRPYTIFNREKVQESEKKIEELYAEKGFFLSDVSSRLNVENDETILTFDVREGKKVKIRKINLLGNKKIGDKELLKLMGTSEGGFFSWLTSSGKFEEETLQKDVDLLRAFYYNKGFVQIKIDEPKVFMSPDKKWLYVTIRIEEGEQFNVGRIDFAGDLAKEPEGVDSIKALLKTKEGELFSRDDLRMDIMALTDRFGDKGFAFANVSPDTKIDVEKRIVDITFHSDKGAPVHIGKIHISGNTKTRDKVIRREMKVDEGDLYDGSAIRRSRQKIFNLSYFKDVNLSTSPVTGDDKMDINIEIEEGPTGTLSMGAGYSSVDGLVGMLQVSQGNLFGKGQKLSLNAEVGGESSNYSLSYTEPYLFDSKIMAGFDIFNNNRDYRDYSTSRVGWGLRTGWPVSEYGRASLSYSYKDVEIKNVSDSLASYYLDYTDTTTSSVSASWRRDTRDNYLNPSKGSDNSLDIEYAWDFLGGDNHFYKTVYNSSWYFSAFSDSTIMLHGRIGYAEGLKGQHLHPDEKFYLGGINTLRGFGNRSVGPEENGYVVGGNKVILFNAEYIFNISKEAGFKGLFFFDAGNAYARDESYDPGDLRKSAGYGFRWYSPMGPLRLEWGKVLDPKPGETKDRWEFSIGTFF